MDSISHTRVANLLLAYVKDTCGVTFDESAFRYGNLKPDLTGTYLTKRHYPSLMYDEVMEKIRTFISRYTLEPHNGRELSIDLGEICHYLTDFFCYPHNDDIYDHNLLAHYIYEKRIALCIHRRLTEQDFIRWTAPVLPAFTLEALLNRIEAMHNRYKNETLRHGIDNDLVFICQACATLVLSIINICYVPAGEGQTVTA